MCLNMREIFYFRFKFNMRILNLPFFIIEIIELNCTFTENNCYNKLGTNLRNIIPYFDIEINSLQFSSLNINYYFKFYLLKLRSCNTNLGE